MITTKSIGMDTDVANPKPVRHVNWTGQPMKEGESYWGESKPQQKSIAVSDTDIKPLTTQPRRKAKRNPNPKAWSLEARAAYSKRMKAWWEAKKNSTPEAAQTTTKQEGT